MSATHSRRWLLAAVGLFLMLPVATFAGSETIDRGFDVKAGQQLRLDLENVRGDLKIEGWSKNRVEVKGTIHGRHLRDGDKLAFDQSSAGVDVFLNYRSHDDDNVSAKLTIHVPRKFDIRLRTSADTRVTGLEGSVDLSIGNGNLELNDVHGECDINTANGHLDIKRSTLEGEINNVNGRLTVDDSDVSGDVESVNGGMRVSRSPKGVQLSSVNGSIDVGSANDHVRANVVNGSVEIGTLDGWIEAETVNGAVKLRMVGSPDGKRDVDIETLNGDVELEIPENFSMDFDIEVRSEGNHERYEIISDFDLDLDSNDSRRGRYRMSGKGTIGGGRNSVHIRAKNGDVILKRVASSR